ncbi:MAG: right-handed parallel beta-helix repeat-containing protein, partial [Methylophilaceae bacterium]|nr:right-handed parallel beta-helix repeat-containing protein [Methylophilaceae bacterium]
KYIEIFNCQHIIEQNNATGCILTNCINSVMRKCSYQVNNNSGAVCIKSSGCTQLKMQQCTTENNTDTSSTGTGFYLAACTNATLSECKALGNGNGTGFALVTSGTAITLDRCVATNYGIGFQIEAINDITLERCLAEGNTLYGFYLKDSTGLAQECIAQGSDLSGTAQGVGFFDASAASTKMAYAANIARDNGTPLETNYSYIALPDPFIPALYNDGATYWQNVQ